MFIFCKISYIADFDTYEILEVSKIQITSLAMDNLRSLVNPSVKVVLSLQVDLLLRLLPSIIMPLLSFDLILPSISLSFFDSLGHELISFIASFVAKTILNVVFLIICLISRMRRRTRLMDFILT